MLNGRIYRAAFAPLLLALALAGFSLTGAPGTLDAGLAPDAFDGARAFAELHSLAARFPERRPGSAGDRALAAYVANALQGAAAANGSGFTVGVQQTTAQTIDGKRTLTTVIAQRPGTTGERPIAIVAHRDAAGRGAAAELSGTAALLELARVFAAGETQRTIVLVSTSGGSGGNAGAADFAARALPSAGGSGWTRGPLDAAIVLGDLAGTVPRRPFVAPFSERPGAAPELLQHTVSQAIAQQAGVAPTTPSTLTRLAQLAFPLTSGEQGPLGAQGVPSVLVQLGDERAPAPREPVSAARLEGLGRAVLSAVYALDGGPTAGVGAPETDLPLQRKLIPMWAVRVVTAALLAPPLLVAFDGLASLRRRRRQSGSRRDPQHALGRALLWAPACGLPFLIAALFAMLLGQLDLIAAPDPPISSAALPFRAAAFLSVSVVALVLALSWLTWPTVMRRLGLPLRPPAEVAGIAVVLLLGVLGLTVWAVDPYTALLLLPALHLWLALIEGVDGRPGSRTLALALVALGLAPLALLIAFYAQRFALGPGAVAHTAVLLLASRRIGALGAVLWSAAGGAAVAALTVALTPRARASAGDGPRGDGELSEPAIRGPLSYAGPGSLGGTESALRH